MIGINKGALKAVNPNLKLELKFNYKTYTDVAGTVAANTNDYVRAWRSTVNSHLFTQSTDAARPQRLSDGLYFDGGDRLTIASNAVFNFGANNFTVEFYLNPTSSNGVIFGTNGAGYTDNSWGIWLEGLRIRCLASSGSHWNWDIASSSATAISAASWTHIVYQRNGNTLFLFLNGVQVASNSAIGTSSLYNNSFTMWAGNMTGKLTDIRIYDIAKYTANFTPPTRSS